MILSGNKKHDAVDDDDGMQTSDGGDEFVTGVDDQEREREKRVVFVFVFIFFCFSGYHCYWKSPASNEGTEKAKQESAEGEVRRRDLKQDYNEKQSTVKAGAPLGPPAKPS